MDPVKLALKRREGVFKDNKILLTNFEGSLQQKDLEKTKGHVQGAVENFYRIKTNVKDAAWETYMNSGKSPGTRDKKLLMFDFNWWPLPKLGGKPEQWNDVFLYQMKGCNINCNFCFVDSFNNNGQVDHGAKYFSTKEIVDAFVSKREELKGKGIELNVLRASGGEPSLVPEQWMQTLDELYDRGLSDKVYFQSDTNLMTNSAITYLENTGVIGGCLINLLAEYKNFGLLSCFKGTDHLNFAENTGCAPELFDEQFRSFNRYVKAGIKVYPHLVNPNPDTLENFMERLTEEHGEEMWVMPHILSIGAYGPVEERLKRQGKNPEEVVAKWNDNYQKSEALMEDMLQKRFGVGYKEVSRPMGISIVQSI